MPALNLALACRMAKACDCTYFIGAPGGVKACPGYDGVGFLADPKTFVMGDIDACLVGTSNDGVVLAFRGTLPLSFDTFPNFLQSCRDWLNDGNIIQVPLDGVGGLVHRGFGNTLLGLWPLFLDELKSQLAGGRPLLVTGHSKGGSVAMLAAGRLVGLETVRQPEVFTFAAARPGNAAFADSYQARINDGAVKASWRFEFQNDIVPHLPPEVKAQEMLAELDARFANLNLPQYESAGTLQFINWNGDIVGDGGFLMEVERLLHLSELVFQGIVPEIKKHHSLEESYIPAVCK